MCRPANEVRAAGNEIQTVFSKQRYRSLKPMSVAVGCVMNKGLSGTLNNVREPSICKRSFHFFLESQIPTQRV